MGHNMRTAERSSHLNSVQCGDTVNNENCVEPKFVDYENANSQQSQESNSSVHNLATNINQWGEENLFTRNVCFRFFQYLTEHFF